MLDGVYSGGRELLGVDEACGDAEATARVILESITFRTPCAERASGFLSWMAEKRSMVHWKCCRDCSRSSACLSGQRM